MSSKLRCLKEVKFKRLIRRRKGIKRFEASGIVYGGDAFAVVFDSIDRIAIVSRKGEEFEQASLGPSLGRTGFEGIAIDPRSNNHILLIEEGASDGDTHQSALLTLDETSREASLQQLEHRFNNPNKGYEAIVVQQASEQVYLLALREAPEEREHREDTIGVVDVYEQRESEWQLKRMLEVPESHLMKDFAAMSLSGDRLAIASQESSRLWLGRIEVENWTLHHERTLGFPRTTKGKVKYGNIEGVAFLGESRLVTVSDKRKKRQPKRVRKHDQSIQVFEIR